MAKIHTRFVCQSCGRAAAKALGRCPQCGEWNTYVEELVADEPARRAASSNGATVAAPKPLAQIEGGAESERMPLSIGEFARVLGGGIVPGSLVLIGGDPGIGKSTLLLQTAMQMAARDRVLYVSGEESPSQIKMRAERLQRGAGVADGNSTADWPPPDQETKQLSDSLLLVTETNLDAILHHVEQIKPRLLIIDSIQTVYDPQIDSSAGSVTQLRECSDRFRQLAKSSGLAVFLIGHVTKEGVIAGPRLLEHMVDTVLYLEGDRFQSFRLLRAVKNRFGATAEVGVFEMVGHGMQEVPNPSEAFLAERVVNAAGSAIAVTMEGTRPLLVEVQGLTSPSAFGNPRRSGNGVDSNRLLLITAVLTRRLGLPLAEQDVFVNVVGGLRIGEPAADLALAAAIASSAWDKPLRADAVLIGEVGLSGELRTVPHSPARLKEAAALGFKSAVIPRRLRKSEPLPAGIEVQEARSLREALDMALVKKAAG
ncbi:MAG: DNA repair protein RadA [Anaerolineales bacterium]|nr:DNA repair protein RadA [Anaerolineales bacterium]MCW5839000.1 DNA repair protein RadA [Anaerolineales bacterium]